MPQQGGVLRVRIQGRNTRHPRLEYPALPSDDCSQTGFKTVESTNEEAVGELLAQPVAA